MKSVIFSDFFSLEDPINSRSYRGKSDEHTQLIALSRGEATTEKPIQIQWAMGSSVPGDIIWTTSAFPIIFHKIIIDLLLSLGFSGWSTFPVEVYSKTSELIPGYYGLSIHGRCARIDLSKSSIELKQFPGGWFPQFKGHYFNPESWDGSDIIMELPDDLGMFSMHRMVTSRVRQALKPFKNIRFVSLPEITVSASNYTIGLRHLLPKDYELQLDSIYRSSGTPRPPSV